MDAHGSTALHYACEQGDVITAGLLMQHPRIIIKVRNKKGLTPIDIAVSLQHMELLKVLSTHTDFSAIINNIFTQAWERDDKPTILFLSQQLSCIEFNKLSIAIKYEDFDAFQRLIIEV